LLKGHLAFESVYVGEQDKRKKQLKDFY